MEPREMSTKGNDQRRRSEEVESLLQLLRHSIYPVVILPAIQT